MLQETTGTEVQGYFEWYCCFLRMRKLSNNPTKKLKHFNLKKRKILTVN